MSTTQLAAAFSVLTPAQIANLAATNNLTQAQLKEALSTSGLTLEQKKEVWSHLESAAAKGTDAAATNVLTASTFSLTNAIKGLWATMLANPMTTAFVAIAAAVAGAIFIQSQYNKAIEESIQKAQELQDAYKDASTEIANNISTVKDLASEFNELSRGVGDHGENISLSADEYDRYLDIVNQLVDINPALVKGYTAEGNAIIEKNSAIQATIDLLKEQQALELAEATSDSSNWEIAKGLKNAYKEAADDLDQSTYDLVEALQSAMQSKLDTDLFSTTAFQDEVDLLESIFDLDLDAFTSDLGSLFDAIYAYSDNAGQAIADNMGRINALIGDTTGAAAELNRAMQAWIQSERVVETAAAAYQSHMKIIAQAAPDYSSLTDGAKDFVNTWIETLKLTGDETKESVDQMTTDIWQMVSALANNPDLAVSLDTLLSVDLDTLGGSYRASVVEQIDRILADLQNTLGLTDEKVLQLKVALGLVVVDPETGNPVDVHDYYVDLLSKKLAGKVSYNSDEINSLSTGDLKIAIGLDLPDGSVWADVVAGVTAVKQAAKEASDAIYDLSAAIDSVSSYEDAYKELSDALSEFAESGSVSADTVAGLMETFGNTNALENFIAVLGQEGVTTEQVREALNNLGKEYLSNSDILSQLTKENAGWVASILEANGVVNAQEVVANRLAAQQLEVQYATELASKATWDEISAFLQEKGATSQVISALASLRAEQLKAKIAATDFATASQSVTEALLEQANAANLSAKATNALKVIQGIQGNLSNVTNPGEITYYENQLAAWQARLNEILSEPTTDIPVNIVPVYSGGGSSSSSSADLWKEEFEAYYNAHKHAVAMEQETLADFYAWLDGQNGYKKYFANNEKYLDEFYQYSEEVFEGLRDLADDAITDGEHQIFLWENQGGHEADIAQKYRDLQAQVHATAESIRESMRNAGWSELEIENSEIIQSLQEQWWSFEDSIKGVFESISDTISDYINDIEHQIFLLEKQAGDTGSNNAAILAQYANLEAYILKQIDELAAKMKALGYTEEYIANSGAMQELQKQLWGIRDSVSDIIDTLNDDLYDSMQNLLDLTIEMIRQEKEDEKEALQDLVDKYQEIVNLRKEMLQTMERERTYQENVDEKTSEIAKLQDQIDSLALDDSRAAAIERASLMEKLADAQKELNELQRDHAIECTEDALDTELENFEDTQQDKIDAIDDFLDDQQALTQAALNRLNNMDEALWNDLLGYALHYTSTTRAELEDMWNAALSAAQNYGSYVEAMNAAQSGSYYTASDYSSGSTTGTSAAPSSTSTASKVAQMKEYSEAWKSASTDQERQALANAALELGNTISGANRDDNGVWWLGNRELYKMSASELAEFDAIIEEMRANAAAWFTSSNPDKLASRNEELAQKLEKLIGIDVVRGQDGYWYYNAVGGPRVFHGGGIAGTSSLKQDELFALIKNREMILTETQQDTVWKMAEQLKSLNAMQEALSSFRSGAFTTTVADPVFNIDASINIDGQMPEKQIIQAVINQQRKIANIIFDNIRK